MLLELVAGIVGIGVLPGPVAFVGHRLVLRLECLVGHGKGLFCSHQCGYLGILMYQHGIMLLHAMLHHIGALGHGRDITALLVDALS